MASSTRKVLLSLAAALTLAAACASKKPPMVSDTGYQSPCPSDRTPTCFDHLGKKTSCHCASREDLRKILEPMQQ